MPSSADDKTNLPVPAGTTVHRLQGKALRQWWQVPSGKIISPAWSRNKDGKLNDPYANPGMQHTLIYLIMLPVLAACIYAKLGTLPNAGQMIVAWLALFLLLTLFFRNHRRHVLEVGTSESGLNLKSPFLNRQIRWLDIAAFFQAGTIEPHEFVLQLRNGEEFLLSKDLTDSDKLFALIDKQMPPETERYELNYRLPDGHIDACRTAAIVSLAVLVYLVTAIVLKLPGYVQSAGDIASLALLLFFFGLAFGWCWLNLMKTPHLIRAGRSTISIGRGEQRRVIAWDQIVAINAIGMWLIVRYRGGWFIMYRSKQEPLAQKMLERQKELQLLTRNKG